MRRYTGGRHAPRALRNVALGVVVTVMVAACGGSAAPAADRATTSPAASESTVSITSDATAAPLTSATPTTSTTAAPGGAAPTVPPVPEATEPPISADELAALEQTLDEIDQLLTDIELDVQQD